MDTNITRQARKDKKITNNQFIREMNKIDTASMPIRYINVEPLFYTMLLTQAYFDIKELKNDSSIKYAMAVLLFASYKLMKFFKIKFDVNKKNNGSNYHLCIIKLDCEIPKLVGVFNYVMFDVTEKINVNDIRKCLYNIVNAVSELAVCYSIDINSILYLSSEYFKEILPTLILHKRKYLANRVKDIRSLYMGIHPHKKSNTINDLLKQKFEEILYDK